MKTTQLAQFIAETSEKRPGTVADAIKHLQNADLFSRGSRGRHSGKDLTESDAINLALAMEIDRPRGEPIGACVQRVRSLMHQEAPYISARGFTKGLRCFTSATAGDALENILRDLRWGRFDVWRGDGGYKLNANLDSKGRCVFISLSRSPPLATKHGAGTEHAIQSFEIYNYESRSQLIERNITLDLEWFRRAADLLGPLE